jgi:hypothetical protein
MKISPTSNLSRSGRSRPGARRRRLFRRRKATGFKPTRSARLSLPRQKARDRARGGRDGPHHLQPLSRARLHGSFDCRARPAKYQAQGQWPPRWTKRRYSLWRGAACPSPQEPAGYIQQYTALFQEQIAKGSAKLEHGQSQPDQLAALPTQEQAASTLLQHASGLNRS